jgi:hypothetical protein
MTSTRLKRGKKCDGSTRERAGRRRGKRERWTGEDEGEVSRWKAAHRSTDNNDNYHHLSSLTAGKAVKSSLFTEFFFYRWLPNFRRRIIFSPPRRTRIIFRPWLSRNPRDIFHSNFSSTNFLTAGCRASGEENSFDPPRQAPTHVFVTRRAIFEPSPSRAQSFWQTEKWILNLCSRLMSQH